MYEDQYSRMYQYPFMPQCHTPSQMPSINPEYLLRRVRPLVNYGLREAQVTGVRHAMTEVALIAYLMGMGYNYDVAYKLAESWEINEMYPQY